MLTFEPTTATVRILGNASLRISSRLAVRSSPRVTRPVRYPCGRERLPTSPSSTGSPEMTKTVAIAGVRNFADRAASAEVARMTSTFAAPNSAASTAKAFELRTGGLAQQSQVAALHVALALQAFDKLPVQHLAVGCLDQLQIAHARIRLRRRGHGAPGDRHGDARGDKAAAIHAFTVTASHPRAGTGTRACTRRCAACRRRSSSSPRS